MSPPRPRVASQMPHTTNRQADNNCVGRRQRLLLRPDRQLSQLPKDSVVVVTQGSSPSLVGNDPLIGGLQPCQCGIHHDLHASCCQEGQTQLLVLYNSNCCVLCFACKKKKKEQRGINLSRMCLPEKKRRLFGGRDDMIMTSTRKKKFLEFFY